MTTTPLLELEDLSVQRGDVPLCEAVNLQLAAGQVCHLVGANGAGKTTLLMQLAQLLPILQGHVRYRGQKQPDFVPLYVSHQLGIHPNLSVAQNLTFLLNLYGMSPSYQQLDEALSWVGLRGYESISSSQLSAGQTRRIALARLYLMTVQMAPLWLLDEPFTALDVEMVAQLSARISEFAASGGAVLMTSHQPVTVADQVLDLSEYLC